MTNLPPKVPGADPGILQKGGGGGGGGGGAILQFSVAPLPPRIIH